MKEDKKKVNKTKLNGSSLSLVRLSVRISSSDFLPFSPSYYTSHLFYFPPFDGLLSRSPLALSLPTSLRPSLSTSALSLSASRRLPAYPPSRAARARHAPIGDRDRISERIELNTHFSFVTPFFCPSPSLPPSLALSLPAHDNCSARQDPPVSLEKARSSSAGWGS